MGGGDSSEWQQAIGGDQEHLSSSHRQPSADPPSPDSTDPKISAYYNVTSTIKTKYVRTLDSEPAERHAGAAQINVSAFPLESTHLGYRCTTCAFSPVILYAGRLV